MNIMLCVVRRFVTLLADVAIICLLLLRKRRRPMVVAATAIVAMLLAAGANGQLTPQTFYHVTDLGTPSGWGGYGINDGGEVVVGSLPFIIYPFVGTGTVPAFLYDGTLHNLGTLGGTQSFGQGINYASHVVGTSSTTGNAAYHAFLYDGTMHDLGTLGGVWSLGYGINDAGYAVGVSYITGNAASHAFLYDGTMHDLGTLGGTLSSASAINNGGLIVGRSSVAGNASSHAFLYDGTMHDLGTLGGTWSEGNDINNVGQGVGSAYSPGDVAPHAFLYDGAMHDLGTLGGTWSYGYGINDAGQVVGSSAIVGDAAQHAYLYDGAMQDLNALIVSPDDWTLTRAMDINNAGQITGTGELNSQEHAVLLSPSTGASAWLSIDTTQSFLTLTGDIDGQAPITEQSPGSLTTALAGTLQADLIGITGAWSDIRLSSANDIHPLGNPGPFQPGNAPADLAGLVNLSEIVGDELFIFAAFRNSVLGVSSGFTGVDASGYFSLSGLLANTLTTFDYNVPGLTSSSTSASGSGFMAGIGHIEQIGNTLYVTIPIDLSITTSTAELPGVPINFHYSGQIVATTIVPEPSTLALATLGLAGAVLFMLERRLHSGIGTDHIDKPMSA